MNLISQEQVQLIFIKSYQILRTRKIDEKYQDWDNAIFSGPEVTESTVIFFTPRPSGFGLSLFHFSVSSSIFFVFWFIPSITVWYFQNCIKERIQSPVSSSQCLRFWRISLMKLQTVIRWQQKTYLKRRT